MIRKEEEKKSHCNLLLNSTFEKKKNNNKIYNSISRIKKQYEPLEMLI